jgi:hypothetical protein
MATAFAMDEFTHRPAFEDENGDEGFPFTSHAVRNNIYISRKVATLATSLIINS